VSAELLDLNLARKFAEEATVDVPADGVARALQVPRPADLTTTYFLRLALTDSSGRLVSRNFYWLSTREDVLDWKNTKWYYTPTTTHSDLTALTRLPPTTLAVQAVVASGAGKGLRVMVTNTGKALAFQVHLKATRGRGGPEVLPAYWDDNYFELLPGEKREIAVSFGEAGPGVAVEAGAWNAPAVPAP
jgi:exo-1,4-beta-D-glucosaminidase